MKKITVFSAFDTKLNPYIVLFKKSIESHGGSVCFESKFNLLWLINKMKNFDSVHLHWINCFFVPPKKGNLPPFFKLIYHFRILRIALDFFALLNFLVTFIGIKISRKKIIFTVHDLFEFEKKPFRYRVQIEIARNVVIRFSDYIHVHNQFSKELIIKRYHRYKNIEVIPHGNYIGYYKNNMSRVTARTLLNLSEDNFVYLFLGLIRPYKGVEDLIRAFQKLENMSSRLLIVGRVFGAVGYEETIKNLAKSDPRIRLILEFVPEDDIQVYFNACDFYVLPYKDITTSGAAALSLSFGRPIIAPNLASFPEIVRNGSGILYDPYEIDGILNALKKVELYNWSEESIFKYAQQFDWHNLGKQLIALHA